MSYDFHDGCTRCTSCDRHIADTETWPCLDCNRMLCDTCECPALHVVEACS